jgi:hypothetical protein
MPPNIAVDQESRSQMNEGLEAPEEKDTGNRAVDELYMERFRQWNSSDTQATRNAVHDRRGDDDGPLGQGFPDGWETSRPAFTQHDGELPTRDAGSPGAQCLDSSRDRTSPVGPRISIPRSYDSGCYTPADSRGGSQSRRQDIS